MLLRAINAIDVALMAYLMLNAAESRGLHAGGLDEHAHEAIVVGKRVGERRYWRPPKEQPPRKLSGTRTVRWINTLESGAAAPADGVSHCRPSAMIKLSGR